MAEETDERNINNTNNYHNSAPPLFIIKFKDSRIEQHDYMIINYYRFAAYMVKAVKRTYVVKDVTMETRGSWEEIVFELDKSKNRLFDEVHSMHAQFLNGNYIILVSNRKDICAQVYQRFKSSVHSCVEYFDTNFLQFYGKLHVRKMRFDINGIMVGEKEDFQ